MSIISKKEHRRGVLKIVSIYAISGSLWIYCSDSILGLLVQDPAILTRMAIFKGIVFIALTSWMLFVLINRFFKQREFAETALLQSYAMLNNLSKQVPGVLFKSRLLTDGHFETSYASSNSYEIYELSPEDIQSDATTVFQRFHPDDYDRIFTSIHESAQTLTQWKCEYRVNLPRQGLKWLYGIAQPQKLEDGTIVWYGIIMDVTERKRVDDMLKLRNFTLGNIADAIFWITPDGRLWDVNAAAEKMLGYTYDQFLSMFVYDIDPEFPAERWPAHWDELKRAGSLKFETVHRSRDGRDIPVEITANFFNYNDREYNCAIVRDITERRTMQEERIKSQKLESLGVLAGGIAHDFNNILTGIMGNISFARKLIDESHRSSKILEQAEAASRRAADLAHQLLTFAKGSQPIKKTVSVREILEASASLVLHGSNVLSTFSIPDTLYAIDADEGQLSQAFNNIIINAAQSMPDGGTITITAENVILDAAQMPSLAAGNYIRISFTDTGCGIAVEDQNMIFDPYFTTKPSGNGLGLASVYSIVSKHGGHISVRSTVGKGTTFDILLPAGSRNLAEAETKNAPMEMGDHCSLLVMDDEEILRDLASEMLGELGYQVQTCSSGDEAITFYTAAKAAGTPFSAVIMDLTVPGGMGGKEAAQHILKIDPNARLIVSSGYSNDPIMDDYTRFGFCATMVKPYSMADVAGVLGRVMTSGSSRAD
jgi:two-component system, cell cycle sensor histidine kinase and response regulator CckA